MVHGLEAKWADEIDFVYLDIDDPRTEPFKRQLGFIYQPQFILLDSNGNLVKQWVGVTPAQELEATFVEATG